MQFKHPQLIPKALLTPDPQGIAAIAAMNYSSSYGVRYPLAGIISVTGELGQQKPFPWLLNPHTALLRPRISTFHEDR